MSRLVVAFVSGLLFAVGLGVAMMTQPDRILGFLDVLGDWDPTLAFVMPSAIAVYAVGFAIARRLQRPVLGDTFVLPKKTKLDPRLLFGAALFGVGWGLAGYCPGPGIVASAGGSSSAVVFVVGLLAGILAFEAFSSRRQSGASVDPQRTHSTP